MGEASSIEWTDATFNPWIGCTKVSEGCANCYAETMDKYRFSQLAAFGKTSHWGPSAPRHETSATLWDQPLRWDRKARAEGKRVRVFCASLADVFDEEAPKGALDRLWALIRATPSLDWQLLTKRPERILRSLPPDWGRGYANVWLGTSVENQRRADERIPLLVEVPARVRFLSCEPLLGPLDLVATSAGGVLGECMDCGSTGSCDGCDGLGAISWVIAGGESGPGARRMSPEWALDLRDQSAEFETAFFFKQWGHLANNPDQQDATAKENGGATKGGAMLDGRLWHDFPQVTA